jgi:hypothetical protein
MTMHPDLDLAMDLAGGGAGCLPLDVARLTAAIDGLELNSVRNLAVRVLTGSTVPVPAQEAPVTVSVPAGSQAPWPTEPPADEGYEPVYVKRDPVHRKAAVPTVAGPVAAPTAAAMAGSTAARPAVWDDTLL